VLARFTIRFMVASSVCGLALAHCSLAPFAAGEPGRDQAELDASGDVERETGSHDTGGGEDAASGAEDAGDGGDSGTLCSGDTHDPNDSLGHPSPLPASDSCDGNGGTLTSVLTRSGEVDYFRVDTVIKSECSFNPTAQLKVSGAELCIITSCPSGTNVNACHGGSGGLVNFIPACCTQSTEPMEMDLTCSGGPTSATVYLRITSKTPACFPYQVQYHQ